jgi:hypothetical protein
MKKLTLIFIISGLSLFQFNTLSAQSADTMLPEAFPSVSIFSQTITEPEEDPETGPDVTITITELFETQVFQESRTFLFERSEPGIGNDGLEFITIGDTLYTSVAGLLELDILEELGFDFDLDLDSRADLFRSSSQENESWEIAEEVLTIEIPEEVLELLPDDLNFEDEMDIRLTFFNVRLPDAEVETPYGMFDTAVFKPSVNVIITMYITFPIIGTVPVNIPILEDYGIEVYFAEGYGIVKEHLEPTIARIVIPAASVDQEITRLPGRTLLLSEFSFNQDTSIGDFSEHPDVFKLHANYPNPFNPSTNLRFELSEPGSISIRIYDIQARLADQALVNRFFNSGVHTLSYDATNLASGQYVYTVQFTPANGNRSFTRSANFTLIK